MSAAKKSTFQLVLVKPTHYDDDGYPITWLRSHIPSNTLAALYGLAEDCRRRQVLGADVEIVAHPPWRSPRIAASSGETSQNIWGISSESHDSTRDMPPAV